MEKIRGTNFGNWLVLEKWMKPDLFEPYGVEDETWLARKVPAEEFAALLEQHRNSGNVVTLTGIQDGQVFMIDPYYHEGAFSETAVQVVTDHPFAYNRVVPLRLLERAENEIYALGAPEQREAVILFNEETRLTAEGTIEYFI